MNPSIPPELVSHLRRAGRVLIVPHVNPDGDAVGSAAAMAHILIRLGAEARILLPAPLPGFLSWLPLPCPVIHDIGEIVPNAPDTILFVDCGDARRAGDALADFIERGIAPAPGWEGAVSVNIDHHLSNKGFAAVNWVESASAATGELAGLLAEHLGIALEGDLARAVYLALVSDTGNFTYANTTPRCMGLAARIVAGGLDIARFTSDYENNWTVARMHLWGRLMTEITLHADGAIACAIVPLRYLEETGLDKSDLESFASQLRKIRGVRVGLFIRQDGPALCKISLRSMGDVDVQAVASLYGGGGHAAAAGAELTLAPEEAARKVLRDLAAAL